MRVLRRAAHTVPRIRARIGSRVPRSVSGGRSPVGCHSDGHSGSGIDDDPTEPIAEPVIWHNGSMTPPIIEDEPESEGVDSVPGVVSVPPGAVGVAGVAWVSPPGVVSVPPVVESVPLGVVVPLLSEVAGAGSVVTTSAVAGAAANATPPRIAAAAHIFRILFINPVDFQRG